MHAEAWHGARLRHRLGFALGGAFGLNFMAMPDAIDALMNLFNAPVESLTSTVYNIGAFSPSAEEPPGSKRSGSAGKDRSDWSGAKNASIRIV